MSNPDYRGQLADLANRFRDPTRLRIVLTAVAIAVAYMAICAPLGARIGQAKRKLRDEERRQALGQDIELLRAQSELFEGRLTEASDVNEWVQYILDGIRARPLQLVNLDCGGEERLNPYHVLALRLNVSGRVQDLDALLAWLETNDRLFRVDVMTMGPAPAQDENRVMQLTLLGLKM